MSRVAAAAFVILLIGVVYWLHDQPDPVMPVAPYPPADLFKDMDLTDALIVGVVHEPDGSPAASTNVFVDAYVMTIGAQESYAHEPEPTTTDSNGCFVFRSSDVLLKEARRYRLKVWAERDDLVAPQVLLHVGAQCEIAQILTLGPSLKPRVKLVDPTGKPVVGAYVELGFAVPALDVFELLYTLGARSGADGVAVLPRLPDRGDWQIDLRVHPEDMPPYITYIALEQARRAEPVTVRLLAGCTVRGKVVLPDGTPAVGARVSACAHPTPQGAGATRTDDRGAFILRGVPPEHVMVTIKVLPPVFRPPTGWGGGAFAVTPDAQLTREIDGEEGAILDLGTLRLLRTHSISGVVLDGDGKPATLGHVTPEPVGGKAVGHSIYAGGRFEVTGLSAGRHTLTARIHTGRYVAFGGLTAKVHNVPAGATDVVIRVTGGGNLVVRFHPQGKPNEPLEVWEPEFIAPTHGGSSHSGKRTEFRRTFKPGRYSDFAIEAEGYREKALGPIEIHADRPTFVDVELEAAE